MSNRRGRRRKYDDEFREGALRLMDSGKSAREVAEDLGISVRQIYKWRSERKAGASAIEREVMELRAAKRQLEMERDILKKALSIFSRGG